MNSSTLAQKSAHALSGAPLILICDYFGNVSIFIKIIMLFLHRILMRILEMRVNF